MGEMGEVGRLGARGKELYCIDSGLVGGDVVDADVEAVFCEAEGNCFAAVLLSAFSFSSC